MDKAIKRFALGSDGRIYDLEARYEDGRHRYSLIGHGEGINPRYYTLMGSGEWERPTIRKFSDSREELIKYLK